MIISEINGEYVGAVLNNGLYANSIVWPRVSLVIEDLSSKTYVDDYSLKKHFCMQKIYDIWHGRDVSDSEVVIDYSGYTENESRVLQELRSVKGGSTISYGSLAKRCGFLNGARFIGNVVKKNRCPLIIPCHRVTRGDGIGNYFYGEGIKKKLLEREGVQL